jgi:hypothetical protein
VTDTLYEEHSAERGWMTGRHSVPNESFSIRICSNRSRAVF